MSNNALRISSTLECDVLVVGAGGAGLRCAAEINEKRPGTKIIAATKVGSPQKSHTQTAQGGMAAVSPDDPDDRPIYHMFDTWKGSDCSADQDVIRKIVEAGWEEVLWLESRGMHFSRDEGGGLGKRTFGGHTINFGEKSAYRCVFEADRTGKGIMDTVWGEALKAGISFLNQTILTELLFRGEQCVGAVLFKVKEGAFIRVLAKATILATGGNGQVFKVTTNCRQNTGDCLAAALQAGLPVMDPEAVQFHPTGIVGPGILASETLRSVGGILRNKDLDPFMERYAPKMKELAPRDLVARAMETEILEGRGILNPDHKILHVWIDLRHLSERVHKVQIPEVSSFFRKFLNLDPQKQLCPVRPSNHYQMGGVPTNAWGEVQRGQGRTVPGLFAVGECAAASFHGFNRLGTNSILELVTMGRFVGQMVVDYLAGDPTVGPINGGEKTFSLFSRFLAQKGSERLGEIRETMRALMTEKVGVFRTEKGLQEAIQALREIRKRAEGCQVHAKGLRMNPELMHRWELENLMDVSIVIAEAALHRRESRGAHYRMDFPERKDAFQYHTMAYMDESGKVTLEVRPIDMSLQEAGGKHAADKFGLVERKY